MSRPRILFVAHLLPWPLEGGGQLKTYHTLQGLATQYDIHLVAFVRKPEEEQSVEPLRSLCRAGVQTIRLPRTRVGNALTAVASLATGTSFIVTRDAAPEMHAYVQQYLKRETCALLWIDHLQMAQFVPEDTHGAKVVLDEHNIEFRIPERIAATPGNPLVRWYAGSEWPRLQRFERQAIQRTDLTLTVSEEDASGLRALAPERADSIVPVPIAVDTDYFAVAKRGLDATRLLSIGTMYWPPNVDAMHYFCREIYPRIRASRADACLDIVGARPVPSIIELGQTDTSVRVTGTVPDVRPYADTCGVFIVPLRSGSGMRVKILNALSMGLPVVSTTVGAEGIAVTPGTDILLADTPEAFAEAVLSLLNDPERATRMGQAGRRLVEEHYSWQGIGKMLCALLQSRFALSTERTEALVG